MSDLYMIRHGQASFGEENYDRLSPTGVVQAEIVARHWVGIGHLCGRHEAADRYGRGAGIGL
jgi:broad specificity phosphatase PhoE